MGKALSYDLERTENGCVKIKGFETRVLITPVHMIAKMYEEMKKVVGPAADIMIREVGKSFAEAMVEIAKGEEGENEEMLTTFLEKVGFGRVNINREGEKYVVEISRSPSCELNMGKCHFEEGVVKGLLEGTEGGRWRTRTVLFDGKKCVIEAVPM